MSQSVQPELAWISAALKIHKEKIRDPSKRDENRARFLCKDQAYLF